MSATVVRLGGIEDTLAFVPHLLGFAPHGALVALALTGPRDRVDFTMHVAMAPGAPSVSAMAESFVRQGGATAVVIAYKEPEEPTPPVEELARVLADQGVDVRQSVTVVGEHWTAPSCGAQCPPEGHLVPGPDSRLAAEGVLLGSAPATSRTAAAKQVAEGPRAGQVGALVAQIGATVDRDEGLRVWASILAGTEPVESIEDIAVARAAAVVKGGSGVRDAILASVCVGLFPGTEMTEYAQVSAALAVPWTNPRDESARTAVDRLAQVVTMLPDEHAVPLLCVLAMFGWWTAQTLPATMAAERALEADPRCRLAHLAVMALSGLRPPAAD